MKKLIGLALMLVFACTSFAQVLITGTVTNKEDGTSLESVSVRAKGSTTGTRTNQYGKYQLVVPNTTTLLEFTCVGYKAQEVAVNKRTVINMMLEEEVVGMKDVVITAFAVPKEKKSLSYVTQQVKGEDLTQAAQPNVANALQGKIAGLLVRQSSGMAGASTTLTLRGNRFIAGNNQPLYVVDGMPIESNSQISVAEDGTSGVDYTCRTLDLNPNDIETLNVLKGATAAALYGMKANNGAIIITTKNGSKVAKTTVDFSSSYTIDQVATLPSLQSSWGQGSGGVYEELSRLSFGAKLDGKLYDNVSSFFKNGYTAQNNIAISNNNTNGFYSIGFGNTHQDGIISGSGMNRNNAHFAGTYNVYSNFKVGVSANYSDVSVDKIASGNNLSNPLFTLYYCPRSYDLWNTAYHTESSEYEQVNYRTGMDNARWALANNKFTEQTQRLFGNIHLDYQPFEFLTVKYRAGIDNFTTEGKEVYGLGSSQTAGDGQIENYTVVQKQFNSNFMLTFDQRFREFYHINFMLGNEVNNFKSTLLDMVGTGIMEGGFNNINNTSSQTNSEDVSRHRNVGFYANLAFDWNNMLYLNASGRRDIVSNMPANHRTFFYPSVGGAFVFTGLPQFENNPALSFGKIRFTFAQAGCTSAEFVTQNVYTRGGSRSGYLVDGIEYPLANVSGYTHSTNLNNPDLKPQNTSTTELGTELFFLDNRIKLDYTYYFSNTENQIYRVPVSSSTGYTTMLMNAGKIQTQGHEIILSGMPIVDKSMDWTISINFSKYNNKVISLADGVTSVRIGGLTSPSIRAVVGESYPVIYGTRYLRSSSGDIVVDDRETVNGQVNANYGMPMQAKESGVIGHVQPDFEMALTNSFRFFKAFTFAFQVDWRKGGQMYSGSNRLGRIYGITTETEDRTNYITVKGVKGHYDQDGNLVVTGTNDIKIGRDLAGNLQTSDYEQYWANVLSSIDEAHVFSTSYFRLREITFSYDLPTDFLKKIKISKASVYFTARNLWLQSDYPYFDPETNTGGSSNSQGFEYVSLPQTRSYGFGINITF